MLYPEPCFYGREREVGGSNTLCTTIHFDSRTIDQSVVLSFYLPKSASIRELRRE